MIRESQVEKKLVKGIGNLGGLCLKLPAHLYKGVPDRIILLPGGRILFVELKKSHKPRQSLRLKFSKTAGEKFC